MHVVGSMEDGVQPGGGGLYSCEAPQIHSTQGLEERLQHLCFSESAMHLSHVHSPPVCTSPAPHME